MINPNNKPVVCIYHDKCMDGLASAWTVKKFFGKEPVTFIPGVYSDPIPDIKDSIIYLVDFSYKREDMLKLMECNHVVLLDHHESAAKELEGLFPIDQTRSGVILTWQYFFGHEPAPVHLQHIQDRDLWVWLMKDTKAFSAGAFTYPLSLEGMDELFSTPVEEVIGLGRGLRKKQEADLDRIMPLVRRMEINGYNVPVVNANYQFASDMGARLALCEPFVVIYFDDVDHRAFSLRSHKEKGVLVNVIAESFGGGGHKNSSGFKIPFDDKRFARSHVFLDASD